MLGSEQGLQKEHPTDAVHPEVVKLLSFARKTQRKILGGTLKMASHPADSSTEACSAVHLDFSL